MSGLVGIARCGSSRAALLAAQRKPDPSLRAREPPRATGPRGQQLRQLFGEGAPRTIGTMTAEATNLDAQAHRPTAARQIVRPALGAAVHGGAADAAGWAAPMVAATAGDDDEAIEVSDHPVDIAARQGIEQGHKPLNDRAAIASPRGFHAKRGRAESVDGLRVGSSPFGRGRVGGRLRAVRVTWIRWTSGGARGCGSPRRAGARRPAPSTDAGDPGFAHQPGDALAAGTHAPGAPLGLGAGCPIGAVRDGVDRADATRQGGLAFLPIRLWSVAPSTEGRQDAPNTGPGADGTPGLARPHQLVRSLGAFFAANRAVAFASAPLSCRS